MTFQIKAEVIKDIKITNNERISKETILIFADIKIGENYDQNDLNKILKEIYNTNFFSNVSLEIQNGILIIDVIENKIIQNITINGIEKKELIKDLKSRISSKDKNPFVENNIENDVLLIKKLLKSSGFYFSDVKTKIVDNNNNTVDLIFDLNLGKKAYIEEIEFIGDKYYKERLLRNIIASEEKKFWKVLSKKKFLNSELISLDKRLLKKFYLDKGHYQAIIEGSFVEYTATSGFKLTYNINAGPKFTINSANLDLPIDYNENDFKKIKKKLSKLEGKLYSINRLNKIAKEVEYLTLTNDYEFIDASFNEKIVSSNKIDLIFKIKEFEKQYLSKVNVFGNNITEEKVIRDNLEVDEGDPFNKILLGKSINNLKSLNIFGKVEYEVISKENNTKILNITIEEKPTGEISAAAGTGTSGSTFGFGIKENNFLGKNISLDTNLRFDDETIKGKFSVINPNWNFSDRSLIASIESSVTDKMADYGYETSLTGFNFGSGWEQYEDLYFTPKISVFHEKLDTNQNASDKLKKQEGSYFDTDFSYGLLLDKRDRRYQTTDGYLSKFNQRVPILSEDYGLYNSYEYTTFNQFKDIVTKISLQARAINSLSDDDVRVSKRLFVSGKRLRGFEPGKVGPKDGDDFIGGNYTTSLVAATTLPEFGANLETIDFQIFLDAANVFGVDYDSSLDKSKIRSTLGFGVDWFTVIGPLNFSVAQPISKADTDKTETFRFNIGTTF
ncbi:MAG: outer membrane protein assembly factor BamA [Candidatus Pelagibacter sp.]